AATVELAAGNGDRQSRIEGNDAADRRSLHVRIAVAEDDILNGFARQVGLLQQSCEDLSAELLMRHVLELSAESAHGGAERFADDDVFGHRVSLWLRSHRPACGARTSTRSASPPNLVLILSHL